MGILSDFFVATADEARRYDDGKGFPGDARIQSGGLTVLELSTLWAALEGRSWDVGTLDDFELIREDDGGERLVHRLPDAFVGKLLASSDSDLQVAAARWAQTDEMGCSPADARPVIDHLVRLAGRATAEKKGLFLWMSV
jgi:hypothetical protein